MANRHTKDPDKIYPKGLQKVRKMSTLGKKP